MTSASPGERVPWAAERSGATTTHATLMPPQRSEGPLSGPVVPYCLQHRLPGQIDASMARGFPTTRISTRPTRTWPCCWATGPARPRRLELPAPAGCAGISTIEIAGPGFLPDRGVEPHSPLLDKPAVSPDGDGHGRAVELAGEEAGAARGAAGEIAGGVGEIDSPALLFSCSKLCAIFVARSLAWFCRSPGVRVA